MTGKVAPIDPCRSSGWIPPESFAVTGLPAYGPLSATAFSLAI